MKQTYDTDAIIFNLLKQSPEITSAISGGIYAGQRPVNSELEDIVINTITLTQDVLPQFGTSNINIHVSDIPVKIGGVDQKVENRARLKAISRLVLDVIRNATFSGLLVTIESQATIQEADINQHFVNIRVSWNIH